MNRGLFFDSRCIVSWQLKYFSYVETMTNLQYNDEQQQITEQSKEQLSLLCEKKLPRVRYAELKSTENIRENITTVDNHKCRVSQRNLQSYRSQNAK